MMENLEKPAYPTNARMHSNMTGVTKREYFAAMAMQGLLSQLSGDLKTAKLQREYWVETYGGDATEFECVAKESIGMADELLKQLES